MNSDLRFLADESCDLAVVRALRAKSYEVLAVSEVAQRFHRHTAGPHSY